MTQAGAQRMTIQVQYVNPPKQPGWKMGSIKDANGQLFNVAVEHLGYFQQGETAEIFWEQTGKYPTVLGKGGQLFPKAPTQPQPGSAAPRTAAQIYNQPVIGRSAEQKASHMEPTPPILSNILATAVEAGRIERPEDLVTWAFHVRQAIENFNQPPKPPESPAHQQRHQGDVQYGNQHPNMTDVPELPMDQEYPEGYAG